jgi:hypothetical protein
MHRLLVTFADWLQNTRWALAVGGSDWAYPWVQLTHFTGLSLWLGTSVAVDFRLLRASNERQTASQLLDALFVWNWVGFGVAMVGGFLLFSTAATSFVNNPAFRTKLGILVPLALVVHILVQRKTRAWSEQPAPPPVARVAASLELLLWLSVTTAAVSIPYF